MLAIALFAACAAGLAAQPAKKLVALAPHAAPALELKDTQGRLHRLADYRGKVVLVNFWATWCEPCREELPSMQALRRRSGAGLVVLAVNYGERAARVEQFLAQQPLDFPALLDAFGQARQTWKPPLLPASYLVGRDGRVRYRALGEIDWSGADAEASVRRLLAESP
ncbi:MAG: TlpA family protein disulfide reductase [Burkholderiales bacterium]|nr:TlpA family protein disulfide reductase [Burkholderiales bacterium]